MTNPNGKGGFQPGRSGNPSGRPAYAAEFTQRLVKLVKRADWRDIVLKAVEQAKRGDSKAREWLSDRLMGKANQYMDVTSDCEPINLIDFDKLSDEELTKIGEIVESAIHRNS